MAVYQNTIANLGVKLEITHASPDVANNRTTITYKASIYKTGSHNPWNNLSQTPMYLTINGQSLHSTATANYDLRGGTYQQLIKSGTLTIPHNSDGSKSFAFSWNVNFSNTGFGYGNVTTSGTYVLPNIARASTFTLPSTNWVAGTNYDIEINRASNSFTHKVSYTVGGVSVNWTSDAATNFKANIPHTIFNAHPSSSNLSATIRVTTLNGSAEVGSSQRNITVSLPENITPTLSKALVTNSNRTLFSGDQQYLRGISRVTATANGAKGVYGSTISSYEFQYLRGGVGSGLISKTVSGHQFEPVGFPNSGSEEFYIRGRVRDSRGRYSDWVHSEPMRAHYYAPPSIGSTIVRRVGGNGKKVNIDRSYRVTQVYEDGSLSEPRNSARYRVQTRSIGGEILGNDGAKSDVMILNNSSATLDGDFSEGASYEVRVVISDNISTVYGSWIRIGTVFVPMDIGPKGVAVGQIHSDGDYDLEVGGGGIYSGGAIVVKGSVIDVVGDGESTLTMSDSDLKYNGKSLLGAVVPSDLTHYATNMFVNNEINRVVEIIDRDRRTKTMVETIRDSYQLSFGQKVFTTGYYEDGDGGAADYIVENVEYKWSVPLENGMFANIQNKDFVNYRMFGARLDRSVDDTPSIKKAHLYADSNYYTDSNNSKVFTCDVVNNSGIIHITDTIRCSSNVDLSGSTIVVDDTSSAWFGSYVWGENSGEHYSMSLNSDMRKSLIEGKFKLDGFENLPPNVVLAIEETHYEIRDDDGYLYDVDKGELMVHRQKGIFSTALGSDWTDAGGTVVFAEHDREFITTELSATYTYIPTQHRTFTGCHVVFQGSADNYSSVIWVRGHNCTVKDFTFTPGEDVSSNTKFKNSMIYVWGSYKVSIKNCNGFNAAGMVSDNVPNPTSGYVIRGYQVSDLVIEDCDVIGIWGSISVSSSKNVYINRTVANRLDVHDYIVNLSVSNCTVYHHAMQIGSGSGLLSVVNTVFYNQYLPEERYPSNYLIALQAGYGRVFGGKIVIQNVRYFLSPDQMSQNFNVVRVNFSPHARSVEKSFKFPEITIDDLEIHTVKTENININILSVSGDVNKTTASSVPPISSHVAYSGETKWAKHLETRNFIDKDYLLEGEIIRKFDRSLNSAGKTAFYNIEYYQVLETANYSINPVGDERPISDLRRIYAPYYTPGARYSTEENFGFVIVPGSKFFPETVFSGNVGEKTSGNYPSHKSGVEWVGDAEGLEGAFLQYESSNVKIEDWKPGMLLTQGKYYMMDTKLFLVTETGVSLNEPLESPEWLKEVSNGSAKVAMVGGLWTNSLWIPEGGKAVVYSRPGYHGSDFTYDMYRAVKRDGRSLGDNLIASSGLLLDGGVIWRKSEGAASLSWKADTEYNEGDKVTINGVTHICEYVQRVESPSRISINNLTHSSNEKPFIFNFDPTSNIETVGVSKIVIDSLDDYAGVSRYNVPFFGGKNNKQARVVEIENGSMDQDIYSLKSTVEELMIRVKILELEEETIYQVFNFVKGVNRWNLQMVSRSENIDVGRLDIINNNTFKVYYNLYETYGEGDFTWSMLKTMPLDPGQSATEYIQLSGSRNDFVVQTRGDSAAIDAPDSDITLTFTSKTNKEIPTIQI